MGLLSIPFPAGGLAIFTLINANRMQPPIAPVGIDYLIGALRQAGVACRVVDLCLAEDPDGELKTHLPDPDTRLVGISFRNVDDCFWPGGASYLPALVDLVRRVRRWTDAPIVLGGVGFSIFPARIVAETGADSGVRGDGERAIIALSHALDGDGRLDRVPGLVWRRKGEIVANAPDREDLSALDAPRDGVANRTYFRRGGQIGIETKRGCERACIYCADPLAKGTRVRVRPPGRVADEVARLLAAGIDVLHFCDSEFNLPPEHARAVCEVLIARGLSERVRWYAYLAVTPFDATLARCMARAGCAGINFTGDAGHDAMLAAYGQGHRRADIAQAVRLCREVGITVMVDLLLGGPGETEETVADSVAFMKQVSPDAVGAALGIRVYPGTRLARGLDGDGPLETNPNLRRTYAGTVDLLKPTFFLSRDLGPRPAEVVRGLIDGDARFFAPEPDPLDGEAGASEPDSSHNYRDNTKLVAAIAAGARGAYWDILRQMKPGARG